MSQSKNTTRQNNPQFESFLSHPPTNKFPWFWSICTESQMTQVEISSCIGALHNFLQSSENLPGAPSVWMSHQKLTEYQKFRQDLARIPYQSRKYNESIQKELFAIKSDLIKKKRCCSLVTSVQRLAYMAMIGVEIDFGIREILDLAQDKHYQARAIGWLALVFVASESEYWMELIIQILQEQLIDHDNPAFQCLALSTVSQIFSVDLYRTVGAKVADLATSPRSSDIVKKKAILVLGQIYKETKDHDLMDKFRPGITSFLQSSSFSIRLATATTTFTMMTLHPGVFPEVFPLALTQLRYLLVEGANDKLIQAEMYQEMPSPWYVKQLIKILGFKTSWTEDETTVLDEVAGALLKRIGERVSLRIAQTYFIVFSEIITLFSKQRVTRNVADRCVSMLVRYLETEKNERKVLHYFALDSLHKFLLANQSVIESVQNKAREALYGTLSSQDYHVSALSFKLLFIIGRGSQFGKEIVEKLIAFLPNSSWEVRADLCETIIKLAESLEDWSFCVHAVIQVLFEAGDYCSDVLWTTAARRIATDFSLHNYAVKMALIYANKCVCPPEQLVKFVLYISGECCHTKETVTSILQFITGRIAFQPPGVQAMMVTTVMKIFSRHIEEFRNNVEQAVKFFNSQAQSPDIEVSERAKQYCWILTEIPEQAGDLLRCVPGDFSASTFDELWADVLESCRCEAGVSQFNCETCDDEPMEFDEAMLADFMCVGSGMIYQDMSISVSANLQVSSGEVTCLFQFENRGILDLTNVKLHVDPPPEMQVVCDTHSETIRAQEQISAKVEFSVYGIPSRFPVVSLSFSCVSTERSISVPLPINVILMMESVKISSQLFIEKWTHIRDSQLESKFSMPLETENPSCVIDKLVRHALGLEVWVSELSANNMLAYGKYVCKSGYIDVLVRLSYARKGEVDVVMRCSSKDGIGTFPGLLKAADVTAIVNDSRQDVAPFQMPDEPVIVRPLPLIDPRLPPAPVISPPVQRVYRAPSFDSRDDDCEEELSSDVGDYY